MPLYESCPRCYVGHLTLQQANFSQVLQGQLISIPNATCYQCDICGYREYEDELVLLLSQFIKPNSDKPDDERPSLRPKPTK